jgi:hypothetical protein
MYNAADRLSITIASINSKSVHKLVGLFPIPSVVMSTKFNSLSAPGLLVSSQGSADNPERLLASYVTLSPLTSDCSTVGRLARPNVTLYVNTGGIPGSRYWRGSIPKYRY